MMKPSPREYDPMLVSISIRGSSPGSSIVVSVVNVKVVSVKTNLPVMVTKTPLLMSVRWPAGLTKLDSLFVEETSSQVPSSAAGVSGLLPLSAVASQQTKTDEE